MSEEELVGAGNYSTLEAWELSYVIGRLLGVEDVWFVAFWDA